MQTKNLLVTGDATVVGDLAFDASALKGAAEKPTYNGEEIVLKSDLDRLIVSRSICYVSPRVLSSSEGQDGDICIVG